MDHSNKLTNYSLYSTVVSTVLTSAAPLAATFVDGLCAGNMLGKAAFNAVNLILPITNLVSVLCLIFNLGGSVLAAKYLAEGDYASVKKYFTLSVLVSSIVSVVCVAAIYLNLDSFSAYLCPEPEEMPLVKQYLRILLLFYLCMPFTTSLNNYFSFGGNPSLTTRIVVIANVVNIALDLLLIGVFKMGIRGAAWATVVSGVLNILLFAFPIIKGESPYRITKLVRKDFALIKPILVQGLGLNVFYIMTNLLMMFSNVLVFNKLGSDGVLVYGVCLQVQSFTFCITYGIGVAGIGQITAFKGDGDYESIRYVCNKLLAITAACYSLLLLLMAIFPAGGASIFGIDNPAVLATCRLPFICYFIYYLCFALISVYTTICLQMSGYVLAKACYVFGLGALVYLLMTVFSWISPEALWYGFPLGGIVMLMCTLAFGYRKHCEDKGLTLFTLASRLPSDVKVCTSIASDGSDIQEMLESLHRFSDICEISDDNKRKIELCCRELCDGVKGLTHTSSLKTFDLTFRQKANGFLVTIKSGGAPYCLKLDESTLEQWRLNPGDLMEEEIRKLLLNAIPDELSYRYVFGMNVTTLTWKS